jgi:predicted Fe-Mo cluster-binding NifX family protein
MNEHMLSKKGEIIMLIAVSAKGKTLEDLFEKRFGRAPYFILYNTEDKTFTQKNNQQNLNAMQGAGIQSAQNILDEGVQVLITGHCGPKAWQILSNAEIKVFCAGESTVRDAIEQFLQGKLKALESADVESHWL